MTVPEFLDWVETQTHGRYELIDGYVYAMAPERVRHNRVKARLFNAVDSSIKRAGLPCEAFTAGMAINIENHTWREPDVSVQCGERLSPDATWLDKPLIVVEVLSPSTGRVDTLAKLEEYFQVPSIQHYLIVDADKKLAVHHGRVATGKIETRVIKDGLITFDPPGIAIDFTAILSDL